MLAGVSPLSLAPYRVVVAQASGFDVRTFLDQLGKSLAENPIQAALTAVVVLAAVFGGPFIARRASRYPVLVERVHRGGGEPERRVISERASRATRWVGRLALLCTWIAAAVIIAVIWAGGAGALKLLLPAVTDAAVRIGASLLVIGLTLVAARLLQRSAVAALQHGDLNGNLVLLGGRVTYVLALLVGFIIVLGIWEINLAVPVTLIGVLTVALSLALQDILRNLVSGVYLLLERPFVIGDQISVATFTGEVEDIQVRVTVLRTMDGERVLIPNATIFTSAMVNESFYRRRRVGLKVVVPADGAGDYDTVERRVLEALKVVPAILKEPAPDVNLNSVASDKLELHAIFWLPSARPSDQSDVLSDAIEQVRASLSEADVSLLAPA